MNIENAHMKAWTHKVDVHNDSVRRVRKSGKWVKIVTFKVGHYTVTHVSGQDWRMVDSDGNSFTGRRGACICHAVDCIEMDRAANR